MRYGIRQTDLAAMLGYEQSYVSAVEIGTKGPPTEEFVGKLVKVLELGEEECKALDLAVRESQRKYVIPNDASTDTFRMCSELFSELQNLHPAQIEMIRNVIGLRRKLDATPRPELGRVRRQRREVAEM